MSGGAGGCCTTCTGIPDCVAWGFEGGAGKLGGTCKAFSRVTSKTACTPNLRDKNHNPVPCLSGSRGAFPAFTSMPQHFKNHGFLTLGVGKLYHDGGFGFGGGPGDHEHPAGAGTPPLADPLSWSNNSIQYPSCSWDQNSVTCPGLPTFVNSYLPNSEQRGSAYLVPAGQGLSPLRRGVVLTLLLVPRSVCDACFLLTACMHRNAANSCNRCKLRRCGRLSGRHVCLGS